MDKEILSKLSILTGLSTEVIDKTYKLFWLFIRTKIKDLPLKEDLTKEEYESLSTNFNIPSLGKLNCPYDRWVNIKKTIKYKNNVKN